MSQEQRLQHLEERVYRQVASIMGGPTREDTEELLALRESVGKKWDPAGRCWRELGEPFRRGL